MNYRADIDGLRALAVVPVIFFHAGYELFSGGFVGVDVFFVISGYLITTILLNDIDNQRFSITHFYERRARRILPALYAVVLVTLIASSVLLLPQALIATAKSALSIPFFSSNFYFWSERGYFGTAAELKPLIHTWSLAVEEQFYIVFPFVLLLLSKTRKAFCIALLVIAFAVSLGASYYVTKLHFDTAFFFPFTRAWELLMGAFCALALQHKQPLLSTKLSECVGVVGLIMIGCSYVLFDNNTLFPYVWALVPTVGTALLILTAANTRYLKKILGLRLLVGIGAISYSLYLWHQPLFAFARTADVFEGRTLLFIAASFILAYVSYRLIETPFRNRSTISTRTTWLAALAGTLAIIAFSVSLILSKGLPGRYDQADQALLVQLATYKGYNRERFMEREHAAFDQSADKKVLLVGDSHAMDFLNVLVESELFIDHSFSTHNINFDCGNLYLEDYTSIQQFIPPARQERCKVRGRYEGDTFKALAAQSDEIWLAASWSDWVVDLLPRSVANLKRDFKRPVRVIGRKNFGNMNQHAALSVSAKERVEYAQPVAAMPSQVADKLDSALESHDYYYPIMDELCGEDRAHCRVFTQDGLLVSADGNHLTREGAMEAAHRIRPALLELRD